MNFYVHQTECKMEEKTILLYFFSVLVGRGGGEVSMTNLNQSKNSGQSQWAQTIKWRNEINLKYIYVGDVKSEKGSSDNLLRTLWTNKEQFPLYKDLK